MPISISRSERALLRIALLRGFSDPGYLPAVGTGITGTEAQVTRVRAIAEWKSLDVLGWSAESDGGQFVLDLPEAVLPYVLAPIAARLETLAGRVRDGEFSGVGITRHRQPDGIDIDAAELAARLLTQLPVETKVLAVANGLDERVAAVLRGDHFERRPPLPCRYFDRIERDVLAASALDCLRAAPVATFAAAIESVDPREAVLLRTQIEAAWLLLDDLGWSRDDRDVFEQTVADEQLARVVLWIEREAAARDALLPDGLPGGEDDWLGQFCNAQVVSLPDTAVEVASREALSVVRRGQVRVAESERDEVRSALLRGFGDPGYLAAIGTEVEGPEAQLLRARALAEWKVLDGVGWTADRPWRGEVVLDIPTVLRIVPETPELDEEQPRAFFDRADRDLLRTGALDCLRRLPATVFVSIMLGTREVIEALLLRARIEAAWRLLDDLGWDAQDDCDEFTQTMPDEQLARVVLWIEAEALDRLSAFPEDDAGCGDDDWLARFCTATLDALPREAVRAASTTVPGA